MFVSVLTSFSFPIPFIFFFYFFLFTFLTFLHHSQLSTTSVPAFETVDQTKMKLTIVLCLMCISYVAANSDCKSMSLELIQTCASCGKFAYGQNVETRDEYFELGMKNCQECKDYMKCMYTGIEQLEVVVLSQALIFEGIIAKQINTWNTPEKKRIIGEKLKQELQVKSPSTFTITSITDQTSETSLLQLLDRRHPFSTKQTSVVKIEYEIRIPSSVSSEDISLYREKMQNIMEKDNDNESSQIVDVIAQEANVQVEQIRMAARAPTEKKKMYRENQAEQELCDAKYSGGLVIDFNRCVEVWEKSAKHGYVDAQINLAKIYRLGSRDGSPMTIPIDQQLAFRWSLAAAKQGDVHCMFRIGVAYYRGRGQ